MSGTDESDNVKNGEDVANISIPSVSTTKSDLNGHSHSEAEQKSTKTTTTAADHSTSVVTSTPSKPSKWVQFGNGDDDSDNVSSYHV